MTPEERKRKTEQEQLAGQLALRRYGLISKLEQLKERLAIQKAKIEKFALVEMSKYQNKLIAVTLKIYVERKGKNERKVRAEIEQIKEKINEQRNDVG